MLCLSAFGCSGFIFWLMTWVPHTNVRNTLISITWNLGLALVVSSQFDVETYLADLNEYIGCFYAGLYVLAFVIASSVAVYYGEMCHSWDRHLADEVSNAAADDVSTAAAI